MSVNKRESQRRKGKSGECGLTVWIVLMPLECSGEHFFESYVSMQKLMIAMEKF